MLTSPECRARAEHYTSIRQQESRRGHGIVAIRVSIGLMVVHYLSSTAIQYQRPLRMLTAILRGCESVDFGDSGHLRMMVADECRGHDIAYRPFSHAETRRRRCLTIRRNAMKLKPGSRGHRKRLTMRRRPRRIMSPRLGPFEKRLHD